LNIFKKLFSSKIVTKDYIGDILTGEVISQGVVVAPLYKAKVEISVDESSMSFRDALNNSINEIDLLDSRLFQRQRDILKDIDIKNIDNIEDFNRYIKESIQPLTATIFNSSRCDYLDIQRRLFTYIGQSSLIIFPQKPSILYADDLLPSDILLFKDNNIIGVVLKKASKYSNSSKLLQELNIPTILIREMIDESDLSILDTSSSKGLFIERASTEDIKFSKTREIKRLKINREEYFDSRDIFELKDKTSEQKIKKYRAVFKKSDNIIVKTADIRLFYRDTIKFEEHIKSILKASKGLNINLALSMVSTPNEFKDIKNIINHIAKKYKLESSHIEYGLVIEVPISLFNIEEFNTLVKFYIIDRESLSKHLFATSIETISIIESIESRTDKMTLII